MKRLIWLSVFILALSACDPVDHSGVRPVASFRITPENGKTTDTFQFDAGRSDPGGIRSKVYYRWDWNRDGIWDGEYTRIPVSPHRFLLKGFYNPILQVINSDGMTDTLSIKLMVDQGFSPPVPSFSITPENGNLKTNFLLDGSGSRDDEEPLEQLRFMWDFTHNGSWDTPLSTNPTIHYVFADTGRFEIALQVVDPQNLRRTVTRTIWITDINMRLVADFKWTPESGTTDSIFILDASLSHNLDEDRALLRYSWNLPPDYKWSPWSYKPDTAMHLRWEDKYMLELRVMDTGSLVNYAKKEMTIYHQNLPPSPKFIIGCGRGNILTQFFFNSWPTVDTESLPTSLEVRWDFDGDEKWDTEFSKERTVYHNYPVPGTYKIYLEARDPDGLSDTTAQFVEVSPWTNETGLILDQRDGQYYGTVKIGTQWWMSQNLNFAPPDSHKDNVQKWCYVRYTGDPIHWCDILGGLYNCYHATREDYYGEVRGICPRGWHMPSRQEWETLVNQVGGWDQADKLLPGGNTDFNALYAGYYTIEASDDFPKALNMATFFWSFNKMADIYAPNSWYIGLEKDKKKFVYGWASMDYYHSVRCVRNGE